MSSSRPDRRAPVSRAVQEALTQAAHLLKAYRSHNPDAQAAARARLARHPALTHLPPVPAIAPRVQHKHALEVVAQEWGFADWRTLRLRLARPTTGVGVRVGPATRWFLATCPREITTLAQARAYLASWDDATFTARLQPGLLSAHAVRSTGRARQGIVMPRAVRDDADRSRIERELRAATAILGATPLQTLLRNTDAPPDLAVRLGCRPSEVIRADVEALRGRFRDGQTDDDVRYVFAQLDAWCGLRLVCVWDYVDMWGPGGNSDFYSMHTDGDAVRLGPIPDGLWDFLVEPEDVAGPAPETFRGTSVVPFTAAMRTAAGLHRRAPHAWDRHNWAWRIDESRELD